MSRTGSLRTALAVLAVVSTACSSPPPPPPRIVLVTIDTLRADHLGLYGYPRPTSPFLDALGEDSVVFESAYSSCPHTAPSHATIFTGLQPAQHRLLSNGEILDGQVRTLARLLGEQGYRTAGFTPAKFLRGLGSGFETFSVTEKYESAQWTLGKAHEWLRRQPPEARCFLWLHLYDVHEWPKHRHVDQRAVARMARFPPRREPLRGYLKRVQHLDPKDADTVSVLNRYDAQILSTDRALRRFFAAGRDEVLVRDAVWIVTADHGEGLGNHGYRGHGRFLYGEQLRVPLIVYSAERRFPPRRVAGLVRLVDVAPTVAELVGVPFTQVLPLSGRSFLPLLVGREARSPVRSSFAQRPPADERRLRGGWSPGVVLSLQTADLKVIADTAGALQVFDLSRDPGELADLGADPPPGTRALVASLLERYEAMMEESRDLGGNGIDPQVVESLKAFGYL